MSRWSALWWIPGGLFPIRFSVSDHAISIRWTGGPWYRLRACLREIRRCSACSRLFCRESPGSLGTLGPDGKPVWICPPCRQSADWRDRIKSEAGVET